MEVLISLISAICGLLLGFPLGFLFKKQVFQEDLYDLAFAHGYDVAKSNFFNPQAKG